MSNCHFENTAILVDGAFYRKRANYLLGKKTPAERANELHTYCFRHLNAHNNENSNNANSNNLYRVFYYDCPPLAGNLYHPFRKEPIQMSKTEDYKWMSEFLLQLSTKRKVALRMGELQEKESAFRIKSKKLNKLCRNELKLSDLTERDFEPNFIQKGVDMKIGLDVASMAFKRQVSQIVLISGDSDFVPVAKYARREGIDFILDPMWQPVRQGLKEHVDGIRTCCSKHENMIRNDQS